MLIALLFICFSIINGETTTKKENSKIEFFQKYIFLDFNLENEKANLVEEVIIDTLSLENNLQMDTRGKIKHSEINLGKNLLELDSGYG